MVEVKELRRRCAVIGSPVCHSLSPVLHRAGYAHVGLDWEFELHEVDVAGLPAFVDALRPPWRGLALTMPLKQAVLPLLDEVGSVAEQVGAANTLLLEPDGRLVGENTDVPGFVAALAERGIHRMTEVSVLGGGATARSAVAALARIAGRVSVYVRSPERTTQLHAVATAFAVPLAVQPWSKIQEALTAPLVVATTPSGVADPIASAVPDQPGTLFDVVYDPWPTPLAAAWSRRGGNVIGGLDLLVHQAALQFRLMTGYGVAVEVLRNAGVTALAARSTDVVGGQPQPPTSSGTVRR